MKSNAVLKRTVSRWDFMLTPAIAFELLNWSSKFLIVRSFYKLPGRHPFSSNSWINGFHWRCQVRGKRNRNLLLAVSIGWSEKLAVDLLGTFILLPTSQMQRYNMIIVITICNVRFIVPLAVIIVSTTQNIAYF